MAQRVSKKKRPSREEHMLREQLKIEEGVFDHRTMSRLEKLFTHGIISRLGFLISKGKEADVYIADAGANVKADFVAVKIFRIETSSFYSRTEYMIGDPRFPKIKREIFWIVNEWCKKEYGNLKIAVSAKAHVPKPYYFNGNVLAIEFLGSDDRVAPQLKHAELQDPKKVLGTILSDVKKLYENELVHADLSEYNILMKEGVPYIIDLGQGVITKHPNAISFLRRDVYNITKYFARKYGIESDPDRIFDYVTGKIATNGL
ncbi:MAG: serine protein kinase RIO [Candidatus Micrarchaeota archaeon]|nr:serine protein kinase RIO [Candidatus Micrarchaeota archaeon]MDE1846524.1 serine protein kinase RIO [Candidatus Micrarchaeota archaeon]